MNLHTKAVHSGDRKKPGPAVPVTTPIYTASTYLYDEMEQLDRVFGREVPGYSYSRYDNPTNGALEELVTALENGHGSLACASGMAAVQIALLTALVDRPKSIVAANALYGATIAVLGKIFEPLNVDVAYVDICDLAAVKKTIEDRKPGCLLMETMSNPLLRVGAIDSLAEIAHAAGAAFVVDNTFATPLLVRPLELGANLVVHSLTKFLAGHGDVLGGTVTSDREHYDNLRTLSRAYGPVLGPFESYLAMRGIKTFPLRMERQCANACRIATALAAHPAVERVHFPADPAHPDAATIARLFPPDPARLQIEERFGVQLAHRRSVGAADVVRRNLKLGLSVDHRVLREQQVAVLLDSVGLLRIGPDDDFAVEYAGSFSIQNSGVELAAGAVRLGVIHHRAVV